MGIWKILMVILLIMVGALFSYFNPEQIELSYYFGSVRLHLAVWLLIILLVGVLLGLLANFGTVIKLRRDLRKIRKHAESLEQEVSNLRALPVRD